jgi:hypothetical protein
MRKLMLTVAVLSLALLGATACGNDGGAASGASELVPAGASLYGEATLKPEGDQKEAIDAILAKFPGGGQAGDRLKELIEKGLRESDAPVSFKEDIEPWLGDEAAFFASGIDANGDFKAAAGLVATDDEDKALETLEKSAEGELTRKEHRGVEYLMDESDEAGAVLDGFLVLGSEPGVKAVIDTSDGGEPLSEDENYTNATDEAADDRLGLVYFNSPELAKSIRQSGTPLPDSFDKFLEEPVVATLDADDDGVTFEGRIPDAFARLSLFGQASEIIEQLPADSWAALGQTNLGGVVDFYVDAFAGLAGGRDAVEQQFRAATGGLDLQRDLIDWMGDFGIFVRGSSIAELDGALVVETKDEEASGRLLATIERIARSQAESGIRIGPLTVPGGGEGFSASGAGIPKPIHAFQRDGRVVFAYGDAAAGDAVNPSDTLGDSPEFAETRDSLGGDYDVSSYVLVEPILALVESTGAVSDADWQRAKPYLEPLSALVTGTSGDEDDLSTAAKLVVK